jgi:biotin operon repressor
MTPDFPSLVATHLFWGKPVTISEIAEDLKVSRRQVEHAIEQLRREGVPIITGSLGVHLTTSPEELRQAYRALRRRYIHQAIGARVLLETAKRFERAQQTTIWDAA